MFNVAGKTTWSELEKLIRNVPLLHQRDGKTIYPYERAVIELKRVEYSDVRPSSTYLARNLLENQRQIASDLKSQGYDPLELDGGLTLSSTDESGSDILTGLIPPIVEQTDVDGTYIVDGSHRAHLGRWAGRTWFLAIVISGIRDDCPFYAEPNTWDDVITYDEPPREPALRKHYRYMDADRYGLYRDFSALNDSRPRYGDK